MHRWGHALLLALAVTGCASSPPPKRGERVPEEAPARRRVKLAVLPVESDNYPRLAKGVNGLLSTISVTLTIVPGRVADVFIPISSLVVAYQC